MATQNRPTTDPFLISTDFLNKYTPRLRVYRHLYALASLLIAGFTVTISAYTASSGSLFLVPVAALFVALTAAVVVIVVDLHREIRARSFADMANSA